MELLGSNVSELWSLILEKGGWTLVALVGLSILTLATVIFSIFHLTMMRIFSSKNGVAGQFSSYILELKQQPLSSKELEERVQLNAREKLRVARRGFRLLELIITAAPLLGLLGTVLGMIDAFQAMQEAGEAVKPSQLAGGIWEALITTAAGMVVALMALAFHAGLEALVDQLKFRLEKIATYTVSSKKPVRKLPNAI